MRKVARTYKTKSVGRPPKASSSAVSRSMKSNKGFGTNLEIALSKLLRKKLVRTNLPGSPEFVYPKAKLVVFALGCFWHHCPKCNLPVPKRHRAYWMRKFERNVEHDRLVREELESVGWRVLEVWEHEIKNNPIEVASRIRALAGQNFTRAPPIFRHPNRG